MAPAPDSDISSAHYASYDAPEVQYGDFTMRDGYGTVGSSLPAPDAEGHDTTAFAADPLFGDLPGDGHHQGRYPTGTWSAVGHETVSHDTYAAQQQTRYDTGGYGQTAWTTGQQQTVEVPQQATAPGASGQWDSGAWLQAGQGHADPSRQWHQGTRSSGADDHDATPWNPDGGEPVSEPDGKAAVPGPDACVDPYEHRAVPFDQQATAMFERHPGPLAPDSSPFASRKAHEEEPHRTEPHEEGASGRDRDEPDRPTQNTSGDTGELPAVAPLLDGQEEPAPVTPSAPRAASRGESRSRRRTPAKRSALLTVAVPSACVMGVAGIAAASVGDPAEEGGAQEITTTAADVQSVQPAMANNQLDTQLESLSAGADDFADRASRTQERIDLKAQQVADRKAAAEEAARQERLRPKFAVPVAQHGLSAYYGQSGINWMSLHTGIDFPVAYGATVVAATDGTVRTQYNSAYGNMVIVTAMDGTETWYCHLSSYQVASGTTVKAGDPIAFSGNSGNSTGPHLHFEVRPAGGSAIDPLAWFRSHGLEPS